jgi:uridine kinase
MKNGHLIVGIVGPSGSGKSSLCKFLKESSDQYELIKLDNYFKDPATFPIKEGFKNWELPSNLKFNDLVVDLEALKNGQEVNTRSFPEKAGAKPEPITLKPKHIILIEGFMLFKDKKLMDMLDVKIYLDIHPELMLHRRSIRFGADHVNDYDTKVAIPEFLEYGITQKEDADYVVDASRVQSEVIKEVKKIIDLEWNKN